MTLSVGKVMEHEQGQLCFRKESVLQYAEDLLGKGKICPTLLSSQSGSTDSTPFKPEDWAHCAWHVNNYNK